MLILLLAMFQEDPKIKCNVKFDLLSFLCLEFFPLFYFVFLVSTLIINILQVVFIN